MSKVGVLLAGCGVQDGSEIYEAVLTILALEKGGASVMALAPDVPQAIIINHYTGDETRLQDRDILAESARIVRGKITSVTEVSAHDLDALILIGGYGAVQNLCSYATDGIDATVNGAANRLINEMHGLGKPIGSMCIASVVVALALRNRENGSAPILSVGNDGKTVMALQKIGARHMETSVEQICIDSTNNLVSTPAFMLAKTPGEAEAGINKLVDQVLSMARELVPGYRGA